MRRVYRARSSLKVFYLVFLALSLFFCFSACRGIRAGSNGALDLAIAIVLVVAGAGFVVQTFTAQIVLADDSIRCGNVFRNQFLEFNRIRYRREYEEYQDGQEGGTNVYYLELVPYDADTRPLKISKDDFDLDTDFWQWMLRVPDFQSLNSSAPELS